MSPLAQVTPGISYPNCHAVCRMFCALLITCIAYNMSDPVPVDQAKIEYERARERRREGEPQIAAMSATSTPQRIPTSVGPASGTEPKQGFS